MITAVFKNIVLADLKSYPMNEIKTFNTSHGNYKKMVEAIKIIIDWEQDRDNGFEIVFSSDYKRIKKYRYEAKKV